MKGRIKNYDKIVPQSPNPQAHTKQQLSEVGRIRVGVKTQNANGREYPTSVDYFVIDSRYAKIVTDKYGEKPTELPIMFYSDNFDDVCFERLEIRDKAGKLFAFGDGEIFGVFAPKLNEYVTVDILNKPNIMDEAVAFLREGLTTQQAEAIKWQPVLTMRFVIKDIPALGYWQFTTKAVKTSIPNLRDKFDQCLEMFKTVRFFPFSLTVKKAKSNKPGDARQYPVVDIVPAFSIETGLQISEHVRTHHNFNQANIALMDLQNLKNESNIKLLL